MAGYRALVAALRFDGQGLVPALIQDAKTGQALTLCYLNRAALKKSLETGTVHLFRRSQQRLMQKGGVSGHIQVIREVRLDCEGKSLLFLVQPRVAACHAGYVTCYFRRLSRAGRLTTVGRRVFDPTKVYREGAWRFGRPKRSS
jgi:phosphoribosyl-AMP cyclohydrolase